MYEEFILFLGTDDLEASHDFYTEILELELYKDQTTCRIYKINEGSSIGFCTHIKKTLDEKSPIITLIVEDVDGLYEKIKDKDVEIESEPQKNEKFNIYHFFLRDNNGYTIEIQKFL